MGSSWLELRYRASYALVSASRVSSVLVSGTSVPIWFARTNAPSG
jgi:hypothetical protein